MYDIYINHFTNTKNLDFKDFPKVLDSTQMTLNKTRAFPVAQYIKKVFRIINKHESSDSQETLDSCTMTGLLVMLHQLSNRQLD